MSGNGETLLVVEDDPTILKLTRRMLSETGYKVIAVRSPQEAIALIQAKGTGDIQLLVTDVVMPEMNGRELSERLQVLCPGLKTLFMSGYTADIIARRGIRETGVHYIQKPFSGKDLAVCVRRAMDAVPPG